MNEWPQVCSEHGPGSLPISQRRRLRQRELTNLLKLNLLTKGEAVFQPCRRALVPSAGLLLPLGVLPPLSTIHTHSSPRACPSQAVGCVLSCHSAQGGCRCCPGTQSGRAQEAGSTKSERTLPVWRKAMALAGYWHLGIFYGKITCFFRH